MRWRKAGDGGKQAGGGQQQEERRKLVKAGAEKGDLVREQQAAPDYFWFHRWRPLFLVCRPAAASTLFSSPGQKFIRGRVRSAQKARCTLAESWNTWRFRRFRRILQLTSFTETNSGRVEQFSSNTASSTLECYRSKLGLRIFALEKF